MPEANAPGPKPEPPFPTAGCLIGVIAIVLFGFMAVYTLYRGFTRDAQLWKFAAETPVEIATASPDDDEWEPVQQKLAAFAAAFDAKEAHTLTLSAAELNAMIGRLEVLAPFRGNTRLKIEGGRASAEVSHELNTLKRNKRAWLNGTLTLLPEVREGELFLSVTGVDVPGKEIPADFKDNYARMDFLAFYKKRDERLRAMLGLVEAVRAENDTVVVRTRARR